MMIGMPQIATGFPDRIPARIVDFDQRTIGVAVPQSEHLEHLQSADAIFRQPSAKLFGGSLGKTIRGGRPRLPESRGRRHRSSQRWQR